MDHVYDSMSVCLDWIREDSRDGIPFDSKRSVVWEINFKDLNRAQRKVT